MSLWWRAYSGAVDHPKLCLLTDRQHRAWFNLLCVAAVHGGALPDINVIALKLRMTPAKSSSLIAELRTAGLFDEIDGRLVPHNWRRRQYKTDETDPTNATRQKRYRDRHPVTANTVTDTVTDTVIETITDTVTDKRPESETEAETERKKDAADAAPSELERQLFDRGKQVAGKNAGGLIAKLLKAKNGDVALARAAIETASTKQNPREYLGAIITGGTPSTEGRRLTADEEYWGVGRTPGIM